MFVEIDVRQRTFLRRVETWHEWGRKDARPGETSPTLGHTGNGKSVFDHNPMVPLDPDQTAEPQDMVGRLFRHIELRPAAAHGPNLLSDGFHEPIQVEP